MDKKELAEKVKTFGIGNVSDLSSGEDLSIAIMNLISIEEHLYFTSMKTQDRKYSLLVDDIRRMRIRLLKELINQPEGELWCVSKHLLSAAMRMIEVGTKHLSTGNIEETERKFNDAYLLYTTFWELNITHKNGQEHDTQETRNTVKANGNGFREMLNNMLNCCKE